MECVCDTQVFYEPPKGWEQQKKKDQIKKSVPSICKTPEEETKKPQAKAKPHLEMPQGDLPLLQPPPPTVSVYMLPSTRPIDGRDLSFNGEALERSL